MLKSLKNADKLPPALNIRNLPVVSLLPLKTFENVCPIRLTFESDLKRLNSPFYTRCSLALSAPLNRLRSTALYFARYVVARIVLYILKISRAYQFKLV